MCPFCVLRFLLVIYFLYLCNQHLDSFSMKKFSFLFLFLITISIFVGCNKSDEAIEPSMEDILSLSDTYKNVYLKRKGHWGIDNDRITSNSLESYLKSGSLSVNFEKKIHKLNLRLTNSGKQTIFEKSISGDKNTSYPIPVTFITNEKYLIEISYGNEDLYLNFIIE